MIPEHDPCILTEALPELDLTGALSLACFKGGEGYAVEFFDAAGNTIDVALLDARQIRPVTERQLAAT